MKTSLIAPCGMNCGACLGYLRDKPRCSGCLRQDAYESSYGRKCIIRSCAVLKDRKLRYCSDKCESYPCRRLKELDKRYRTKYSMSMLENLENIKKFGIRKFVRDEKTRWACANCGSALCIHRNFCLNCGKKR